MIVNRASQESYDSIYLLCESMSVGGRKARWGDVYYYLQGEKFASGDYVCFVAYVQGVPSGVVVAERHDEGPYPYFDVHNLYVIESCRGKRVALALLREALSLGKDDEAVYLTTAGPPHPLYTRLGFRPTHSLCVSTVGQIRERLK